jgi:hypothetical protein
MLPFMLQSATKVNKSKTILHPKLDKFPALLPANPPMPPDILYITPPASTSQRAFLSGTFPISTSRPSRSLLTLAQMSDRMAGFLEIIIRGLESAQHAFAEGEKQTMIWREELETCGEQQGGELDKQASESY